MAGPRAEELQLEPIVVAKPPVPPRNKTAQLPKEIGDIFRRIGIKIDTLTRNKVPEELGEELKKQLQRKFNELRDEFKIPEAVMEAKQQTSFLSLYYPRAGKDVPKNVDEFVVFAADLLTSLNVFRQKAVYWDQMMQLSTILLPSVSLLINDILPFIDAYYGHTVTSNTTLNIVMRIVVFGLLAVAALFQQWGKFSRDAAMGAYSVNADSLTKIGAILPPKNGPLARDLHNGSSGIYIHGVFQPIHPGVRRLNKRAGEVQPEDPNGPVTSDAEVLDQEAKAENTAILWKYAEEFFVPLLAFGVAMLGTIQTWVNQRNHHENTDPLKFNTSMSTLIAAFGWGMLVLVLFSRTYRNNAKDDQNQANSDKQVVASLKSYSM